VTWARSVPPPHRNGDLHDGCSAVFGRRSDVRTLEALPHRSSAVTAALLMKTSRFHDRAPKAHQRGPADAGSLFGASHRCWPAGPCRRPQPFAFAMPSSWRSSRPLTRNNKGTATLPLWRFNSTHGVPDVASKNFGVFISGGNHIEFGRVGAGRRGRRRRRSERRRWRCRCQRRRWCC
jgi:hypothetical protein